MSDRRDYKVRDLEAIAQRIQNQNIARQDQHYRFAMEMITRYELLREQSQYLYNSIETLLQHFNRTA